jgi:succinyl-CoA synthetase alpha subunit
VSLVEAAGGPVLIQGITGRVASRHTSFMRSYGTDVVAGVAPGRGGREIDGIPVYDTVERAVAETGARASVAFLPPAAVGDGIAEAAEAGLELCVSVTEGVPLHDLLDCFEVADQHGMKVLGPNCPGMMSQGEHLLGFLPVGVTTAGSCAVIARSGTLSYEAVYALGRGGLGISLWIGVGGDGVKGSTFADLVPEVRSDPRTEALVVIGEIGGTDEEDLAVKLEETSIPTVALLAGSTAPEGIPLGHAGAIVEGGRGTYAAKRQRLEAADVRVVEIPSDIPDAVQAAIAGKKK